MADDLHEIGGELTPGASMLGQIPGARQGGKMTATDDRAVRDVRLELTRLLARLDQLDLHQAGAHLSMAVHCLEDSAIDGDTPSAPPDRGRRRRTP